MCTIAGKKLLQVCLPRRMEYIVVSKMKCVSLVRIENCLQINKHDRKDILEQAAECINDISMAPWVKIWEKFSILHPWLIPPGCFSLFTYEPLHKIYLRI